MVDGDLGVLGLLAGAHEPGDADPLAGGRDRRCDGFVVVGCTAARPPSSPRPGHAGARAASRRPGVAPDHAAARGQPSTLLDVTTTALPPGRRVVALGEVDGMPHHTHSPAAPTSRLGHPGDLPARRGRMSMFATVNATLTSKGLTCFRRGA